MISFNRLASAVYVFFSFALLILAWLRYRIIGTNLLVMAVSSAIYILVLGLALQKVKDG
jgi:hypothetical protein